MEPFEPKAIPIGGQTHTTKELSLVFNDVGDMFRLLATGDRFYVILRMSVTKTAEPCHKNRKIVNNILCHQDRVAV